jgi:hypothetical protein
LTVKHIISILNKYLPTDKNYESLDKIEKEILSKEQFDALIKDCKNEKLSANTRISALKLLKYSYNEIEFDYSQLTDKEKKLMTPNEFKSLVSEIKANFICVAHYKFQPISRWS